jgi:hypothetical protein
VFIVQVLTTEQVKKLTLDEDRMDYAISARPSWTPIVIRDGYKSLIAAVGL